jgi:hypothetical protein
VGDDGFGSGDCGGLGEDSAEVEGESDGVGEEVKTEEDDDFAEADEGLVYCTARVGSEDHAGALDHLSRACDGS